MGKTRDVFKKMRHSKGTLLEKIGTMRDRNGMDLMETEDIKKRWQEYIELYKKDLNDPDNLECEIKWALGSITMNKTSGGDGIPAELFKTLKDDVVEVLHSICHKFGRFSSGHRTGKGQFSFQSQKKGNAKDCSNYCIIALISHTSKVMFKILQVSLQKYMN